VAVLARKLEKFSSRKGILNRDLGAGGEKGDRGKSK
jgi:hypothetical protein